jgi:diguanylate cyclase (GGDEF)-like protein/PAS domain S-box-containing protein
MDDGTAREALPARRDRPAARRPSDALYRSLVDDAFQCVMTVRNDLTVGFVNPACFNLLGWTAEELEGTLCTDYVHPDDLDRAVLGLGGWTTWGMPGGSSSFRLRHRDGSWQMLDMSVSPTVDDEDTLCAVTWRPAGYQHAVQTVLTRLLEGHSRAEAIEPLLDVFDWALNDTHIAIAWFEPDRGHQFVTTGLPRELTGAEAEPGAPWQEARDRFTSITDLDGPPLDDERHALAERHERGAWWVQPISDAGSPVPALITVFPRHGGPPPKAHSQGMTVVHTNVELVLQWSHQVALLDAAANTDSLTGLPNRRSLFDLLDRDRRGGALLFCDLDRFKPVNDEFGHAVGDEVLRQVADRLRACVREDDVVARTGGDEFVVLARGASEQMAGELATRIARTVETPFDVGGIPIRVGISIGTARSESPLTDTLLAQADQAMLAAKARRHHPTRPRAGASQQG